MLDAFFEYNESLGVPKEYLTIVLLQCIATCIGRKVWWRTRYGVSYISSYVMLMGKPGSGKSIAVGAGVAFMRQLAKQGKVHLGATNITKAGMIEQLAVAERSFTRRPPWLDPESVEGKQFWHLSIMSSELGTLTGNYNPELLTTLSTLYDNDDEFQEGKRGPIKKDPEGKVISNNNPKIINPTLSLMSGAQPKYYTEHVPLTSWEQGYATRPWYEYITEEVARDKPLFSDSTDNKELFDEILREFVRITAIGGPVEFNEDALKTLEHFYKIEDFKTRQSHSLLDGFNQRRALKLQNYSVMLGIARHGRPYVTQEDVEFIMSIMYDAEDRLNDLLEDTATSADGEVLRAIFEFIKRRHNKENQGTTTTQIKLFLNSGRGDVHKNSKYLGELESMDCVTLGYRKIGGVEDKSQKVYYPKKGFVWK